MKKRNVCIKLHMDNKGASVVAVIVVIALIGLFVASVMFSSLYNHQIRAAELLTQDTFYTADSAMEEIRVGLTKHTSEAMAAANLEVLQLYSASAKIDETKNAFKDSFIKKFERSIGITGTSQKICPASSLKDLITGIDSSKIELIPEEGFKVYTAADKSSLTIRGVEVRYRNDNGYISRISTDIRISIPEYSFNTDASLPDLARFSLIGQQGIVFRGSGTKVLNTSIFAGSGNDEDRTNGIGLVLNNASVSFEKCPYIISESKVDIANTDINGNNPNSLIGKASLSMDSDSNLWAEDINVYGTGSRLDLDGTSYVRDDLTIYGKNNSVILSGKYYGYGKNGQSAILVNGAKTKLDLSALKTLLLTGSANIGVKANEWLVNAAGDPKQVPMGESFSAKGAQLAYLAPPEIVGINTETNTALMLNPIPDDRKLAFENLLRENKGIWIDVERALPNMEGKTLMDYNVTNGNDVYIYTDNKSAYSYVYLKFPDEKTAGRFFRDYYEANRESMSTYLGFYIDVSELKINGNLFDSTKMGEFRVDVAGNILTRSDTYQFGNDKFSIRDGFELGDRKNETEGMIKAREAELTEYEDSYKNLCHKLTTSPITPEEESRTVFDNYINPTKLSTLMNINYIGWFEYTFSRKNEAGELIPDTNPKKVCRVNMKGDILYGHSNGIHGDDINEVMILIGGHDVYIYQDFEGIVLARGKIYVSPGVTIKDNNYNLSELLRATATIPAIPNNEINGDPENKTFQLAELFNEDDKWTPMVGNKTIDEDGTLNPSERISFFNWTRN